MKKPKLLLVDESLYYWKLIKELSVTLDIDCFPATETEFTVLRSSFTTALNEEGEQVYREQKIAEIEQMIAQYIGEDSDTTVFCICGNELLKDKPEINGRKFYMMFLKGKRTVITTTSENPERINHIEYFCSENEQCSYLHKGSYPDGDALFTTLLTEKIISFIEE